jgi:hypothetical protein
MPWIMGALTLHFEQQRKLMSFTSARAGARIHSAYFLDLVE